MLPRALEVLLVALLIMATLGVAFQFQNQQLLQDILLEMRNRPSVAMTQPGITGATGTAVTPTSRVTPAYANLPRAAIVTTPPDTNYAIHQITTSAIKPAPAQAVKITPVTPSASIETTANSTAPTNSIHPDTSDGPSASLPNVSQPDAGIANVDQVTVTSIALTPSTTTLSTTPESANAEAETQDEADLAALETPVEQPGLPVDPVGEAAWGAYGPTVELIIKQLMTADYDPVMKRLDDQIGQDMTREGVAKYMQERRARYGDFKTFVYHEFIPTDLPSQYSAFDVGVETASGYQLVFTITLDNQKRISGLYVH